MPDDKPPDYYSQDRAELTSRLPRPLGDVLDIGCGAGGVGGSLRRGPAERLVGIEIDVEQAELAAKRYDRVIAAPAEKALEEVGGTFQTILCYDVLEHLIDPAALLRRLSDEIAVPGAVLHLSIPNARHASLMRDLVFRGTFGYQPYGHRDATHLRWFTRADIERLLQESGWRVVEVVTPTLKPSYRLAVALTGGRAAEFLTIQWYVLARRDLTRVGV